MLKLEESTMFKNLNDDNPDFVVDDVEPKYETVHIPILNVKESSTYETLSDDNPEKKKRKVNECFGK